MRWMLVFGSVVAVLLAANLIKAESGDGIGGEPFVVQISAVKVQGIRDGVYRFWSDGAVDMYLVDAEGPGDFDLTWMGYVPLETGLRADLNADGCVGAVDLLIMLTEWQPCDPLDGSS